jgi:hypothetical protein
MVLAACGLAVSPTQNSRNINAKCGKWSHHALARENVISKLRKSKKNTLIICTFITISQRFLSAIKTQKSIYPRVTI